MSKEKVIKLFTDGEVKVGERQFTRLIGGFGEGRPMLSDKQVAELLGYAKGARAVRERLNRKDEYGKENIKHFEFGVDILDLQRVAEKDTFVETLMSLGYAKQSITQADNIYLFSESGFLLFLKFAEGDKAVELYKDFIEKYFKTKAENESMKDSIEEEIKSLIKDRATCLGMSLIESDNKKKLELAEKSEELNRRIIKLEKSKSEEEIIKKVQDKINIADNLCTGKHDYDIGKFSKSLAIPRLGRNKLFEWLRDNRILDSNNIPYQKYMKYFSVANIPTGNGYVNYKTMIKPNGIGYLIKKLEKDGKLINKSVNDILKELNKTA